MLCGIMGLGFPRKRLSRGNRPREEITCDRVRLRAVVPCVLTPHSVSREEVVSSVPDELFFCWLIATAVRCSLFRRRSGDSPGDRERCSDPLHRPGSYEGGIEVKDGHDETRWWRCQMDAGPFATGANEYDLVQSVRDCIRRGVNFVVTWHGTSDEAYAGETDWTRVADEAYSEWRADEEARLTEEDAN